MQLRKPLNGKELNPIVVLIFAVVNVSLSPALTKLILNEGVHPVAIACLRLGAATLMLLPVITLKKQRRAELAAFNTKELLISIASGIFLAIHYVCWFYSLLYTTIFAATLLVNMQPVFMLVLSRIIFKEKAGKGAIAGVAIAVAGSIIIVLNDSGGGFGSLKGDILALIGALFFCFYLLCGRVVLRRPMSVNTYTIVVYGSCALLLLVWSIIGKIPLSGHSTKSYLLILAVAVMCTLLGHSLFNWCLKHMKASIVAMSCLGEVVGAGIYAWLFFGEIPTLQLILGGIITISGILIFNRASLRDEQKLAEV